MKVDLNRKFKDFKGLETENIISDKVAEALYSAGATPEFAIKRDKGDLLYFLYGGSLWSNP